MIKPNVKTIAICFVGFLCLPSLAHAQSTTLSICNEILENEPNDAFCKGYKKGYTAALENSGTTPISGTFEQTGTFRYSIFEPQNPVSGNVGQPAFDPFMVTLPSNYKELLDSGEADWATISDPSDLIVAEKTYQIGSGEGTDNIGTLKLKQSVGVEAFVQDNEAKRQALEALKPYIRDLGSETIGTQILVREAPAAN